MIKGALSLVVILGIIFFFYRAFQENWTSIQSYTFKLNFIFISFSFVSIVITYLLATYGWFLTLNSLSKNKITFLKSIATVHSSNLTKYIPGKVWSYALQMYWLVNAGFSKSLILYVNLITLYVSLITSVILGFVYLVFAPRIIPLTLTLSLLVALILFDLLFIKFNSYVFKTFIVILNKIFKRDIKYYETPWKLIYHLHGINFLSAFCLGIGAYLLCLGIGFDVDHNKMFLVMSSMMIADVIGFIAVIAPGGVGIRESVMYLMLSGVSVSALSLILPIATRIVSMLVDIFLGTISFVLLKNYKKTGSR